MPSSRAYRKVNKKQGIVRYVYGESSELWHTTQNRRHFQVLVEYLKTKSNASLGISLQIASSLISVLCLQCITTITTKS